MHVHCFYYLKKKKSALQEHVNRCQDVLELLQGSMNGNSKNRTLGLHR